MVPGKLVPGKMVPEKNCPQEKWSPENWSPEKWSPEKFALKIVLRQKNARIFKRLCYFYQLIPLHTQKNVRRLRQDPTYIPNCGTLKESRKICCRVLGFHRLITSQHSTHTPRCSTPTPRFFVSKFPGDHFSQDQFSGGHFSRGPSFPGPFFRGPFFRGPFFRGPFFWGPFFRGPFFRGPFFGDHFSGIRLKRDQKFKQENKNASRILE